MDMPSDKDIDQGDTKIVDGNASTHSWRDALPVELRNNPLIKDFQKPGDAIQDYIKVKEDTKSMLRLPGEQASAEEKAAFYTKLGRPESPEKYDFKRPEGIPDNAYSPELEAGFRKFVFEKGLSKQAASDIYNWYNEQVKGSLAAHAAKEANDAEVVKQATESAINKLKDEWKGDAFNANTAIAAQTFNKFAKGNEEAINFIKTAKVDGVQLGNHPVFLKLFHEIGKLTSDDSALLNNEGGSIDSSNSLEAQANKMFPSMTKKAG